MLEKQLYDTEWNNAIHSTVSKVNGTKL